MGSYNASKSAKIRPEDCIKPPKDEPAVRLGYVSDEVGLGIFAARDIAAGEYFLHEAPLLKARFNEQESANPANLATQRHAFCQALRGDDHGEAMLFAYPRVARRFGRNPPRWQDVAADNFACLGRHLVHGRFAGADLTEEKYARWAFEGSAGCSSSAAAGNTTGATTTAGLSSPSSSSTSSNDYDHGITLPNWQQLQPQQQQQQQQQQCNAPDTPYQAVFDLFKGYAFMVDPSQSQPATSLAIGVNHEACVYLIGSLINHCCVPDVVDSGSGNGGDFVIAGTATDGTDDTSNTDTDTDADANLPPPGPNSTFQIGPRGLAKFVRPAHMAVQARRAIAAGEEITFSYGKKKPGFTCRCATCRRGGKRWASRAQQCLSM